MKRLYSIPYQLVVTLSFFIFGGQAHLWGGESGIQEDIERIAQPPSDMTPFVHCGNDTGMDNKPDEIDSEGNPQYMVNGQLRTYLSSEKIDYFSDGWVDRLPASWTSLGKNVLGYKGVYVPYASPTPASVPHNIRALAIDIRFFNGKPYYHYFSNGLAFYPLENWSSTKIQGVLFAAKYLREQSMGRVGLNSKVGSYHVGDLITRSLKNSNNPIAGWFKTIGGSSYHAKQWVAWVNKPAVDPVFGRVTIAEDFTGRYGTAPSNIGGSSIQFIGADNQRVSIPANRRFGGSNILAPITMSESLKRVLLDEEDLLTSLKLVDYRSQYEDHLSLPHALEDEDLAVLMYGNPDKRTPGGMLAGGLKDSIVKQFAGHAALEEKTNGKWRIFGKTGSGYSGLRKREEAVYLGGVCLPEVDGGRQFVFFVNAQAKSVAKKYTIRNRSIWGIGKMLVPSLYF